MTGTSRITLYLIKEIEFACVTTTPYSEPTSSPPSSLPLHLSPSYHDCSASDSTPTKSTILGPQNITLSSESGRFRRTKSNGSNRSGQAGVASTSQQDISSRSPDIPADSDEIAEEDRFLAKKRQPFDNNTRATYRSGQTAKRLRQARKVTSQVRRGSLRSGEAGGCYQNEDDENDNGLQQDTEEKAAEEEEVEEEEGIYDEDLIRDKEVQPYSDELALDTSDALPRLTRRQHRLLLGDATPDQVASFLLLLAVPRSSPGPSTIANSSVTNNSSSNSHANIGVNASSPASGIEEPRKTKTTALSSESNKIPLTSVSGEKERKTRGLGRRGRAKLAVSHGSNDDSSPSSPFLMSDSDSIAFSDDNDDEEQKINVDSVPTNKEGEAKAESKLKMEKNEEVRPEIFQTKIKQPGNEEVNYEEGKESKEEQENKESDVDGKNENLPVDILNCINVSHRQHIVQDLKGVEIMADELEGPEEKSSGILDVSYEDSFVGSGSDSKKSSACRRARMRPQDLSSAQGDCMVAEELGKQRNIIQAYSQADEAPSMIIYINILSSILMLISFYFTTYIHLLNLRRNLSFRVHSYALFFL
ncbi:unnamed protein product [Protopolystoma xenopodis]|uniref:Uncharacterized protein n=1 Tax=Protopolystoma xenopodis TaxID=117903 RepID=A0A3S5B5I6_9PLAT|nr:unnamed protein product [Protopolystoma xenopodis]